jgi:hypothetical protein
VQGDLVAQRLGVLGEAAAVLVHVGALAEALAEEELAVDQVEGGLGAGGDGGVAAQVLLRRHPLARLPAPPLVRPQHGRQLVHGPGAGRGQEGVHVGPPELLGPVRSHRTRQRARALGSWFHNSTIAIGAANAQHAALPPLYQGGGARARPKTPAPPGRGLSASPVRSSSLE